MQLSLQGKPSVDHGMSLQFRVLASSGNYLPRHFNARRMNGDRPSLSLGPNANCISYAPVLHWGELGPKLEGTQCLVARGKQYGLRRNL